ncbi:MAG: hypothetical protein K2W85_05515 [Phycisphaerales bacterium]|nr:hypothetical protein [Phycisphaerales bacterium]
MPASIRRPLILASTLALGLGLGACQSYHPGWYEGDGVLTALPTGKNGADQYEVEFPPIDLMKPGRHTLTLKRLPNEQLLSKLSLDEPSREKLDWIEKARVRVVMTLIESESGRTSMKDGHLSEDWATTAESWNGQPVDFVGIWFRPQRHDEFTLVIDVWIEQRVENAPPITATPRLAGGGVGTR